jgi:diguanylate cyclase (GGDEF)-like protein
MSKAVGVDRRPGRQRSPLSRRWNLAFNLIVVGFCAICALLSLDVRRGAWQQARQSAGNVVSALQTDIERNIELYDLSLQGVVDNLREPGLDKVSPEIRHLVLFDRAATAKYMGSILVLDPQGAVVLDSRMAQPPLENYGDRDYFTAHVRKADLGLYVSRLGVDRNGEYVVGISRRLSRPDGAFAGVVVGTLRVAYFNDLFRKLNLGHDSTVALLRTDGTMLARLPVSGSEIGRNLANSSLFKHFNPESPSGAFETVAMSDGINRLFTYSQVGHLPLILSVGLSTEQIDAGWRRESGILGLIVALLVIAIVFLKRRLAQELGRRLKAETALSLQARTDSLTGLPNRRWFDEVLAREWRRAMRTRTPLGLLMIDADHFKSYNDEFGHQAGDRLLIAIAASIATTSKRATDFAARYGGEEFVVLLCGPDAPDAAKLAERICATIAAMGATPTPAVLRPITVSIGVACLVPHPRAIYQDLIGTADRAMFEAKQSGRNRVVTAALPDPAAKPRLVA